MAPPPSRRIDALLCSKEDAPAKAKAVIAGIAAQAAQAKEQIDQGIDQAIKLLEERKQHLEAEVAAVVAEKTKLLEEQLKEIREGRCQPAPPEDPDDEPDPDLFLLCTDEVLHFHAKLEELQEQIKDFGGILQTSTYASNSYARGPVVDDAMKTETKSLLWVYANDLAKVQRKSGGENLVVEFSTPEDFETEVEDMKDGRYKVRVTPKQVGKYTLRIAIGKPGEEPEEIHGSPFDIEVLPPPVYTKIGVDRLGSAGKPWVQDELSVLLHPLGLAFDRTGKFVFVADQANDRVQVFDVNTHTAICAFGHKGAKPQEFDAPGNVIVDREERVYVSDILNHRIQVLVFNPKSKSLWHVRSIGGRGKGPTQFEFPRGLAITEEEQLLVCDSGNDRVQVLDMNNDFTCLGTLEVPESVAPIAPLDVAVSRAGDIFVSDQANRILVFDSQFAFQRVIGKKGTKDGMFNYPVSIRLDDMGKLFVCDQGNRRIQIINAADGAFVHKWSGWKRNSEETAGNVDDGVDGGSPPVSPEPPDPNSGDEWVGVRCPAGIAVNSKGVVVVSDYKRHFLFKY